MDDFVKYLKDHLILVGGIVVAVLLGVFILMRQPQSTTMDFPDYQPKTIRVANDEEKEILKDGAQDDDSGGSHLILVDVKGAVVKEGLYELDRTARVNDAIKMAGGFLENADRKTVNLAQKLSDEAVVYVASQGEVVSTPVTAVSGSESSLSGKKQGKINLNTATVADLTTISGIGEKRAQDILDYRDSQGGFRSVDDLSNVSGIGAKTLEKLRDEVCVD